MKKTLIAAGIAAAMAAPVAMADATVFGKVRMAYVNGDSADAGIQKEANRFGFQGSEDLGNGLTAFYKIELQSANDTETSGNTSAIKSRDQYVGLKGSWGAVVMGDHSSPQKASFGGTLLEDTIADKSAIIAEEGGYKSNIVGYSSPTVNGFTVKAALASANSTTNSFAANSMAAIYENGPMRVAIGATNYDAAASGDSRSLTASYKVGDMKLTGMYEEVESGDKTSVKEDNMYLDLSYTMGKNVITVAYGENDNKLAAATNDIDVTTVALTHNFSKRTNVQAIYNMKDNQTSADVDDLALQINHSF
jgi:predicted porin